MQLNYQRAAELISKADGLIITAGAGIGIDSGLPDFRGDNGFWQEYPALRREGIGFSSIANPDTFEARPRMAWGFYGHRLQLYRQTKPHDGFKMLHAWAKFLSKNCFVFTSNVDGQFQQAGFVRNVAEAHGSIHHMQCMDNCIGLIWTAKDFLPEVDTQNCLLVNDLPRCPECGALARPNILMFGDWDWLDYRAREQVSRLKHWSKSLKHPVVIEIDTGVNSPTVRRFGRIPGAALIRINPRESNVERGGDVAVRAGALEALKNIDEALRQKFR